MSRRLARFPRMTRVLRDRPDLSIKDVVRAMDAAGLEDGRKWASEYDTAGPDGRQFPGGDSFRFLYNHLKNARYMAFYCRHFGIDEDRIAAALGHANGTPTRRSPRRARAGCSARS